LSFNNIFGFKFEISIGDEETPTATLRHKTKIAFFNIIITLQHWGGGGGNAPPHITPPNVST